MRIKNYLHYACQFQISSIEKLLKENKNVEFTGFYLNIGNMKQYIYKFENTFYLINANHIDEINDKILEKENRNSNIKHSGITHCPMSLYDLVSLYKKFENKLSLQDNFFFENTSSIIKPNMNDFLKLVREIIKLENEIKNKGLNSSYEIMKYIYDKYKLECDYWDPIHNYGTIREAGLKLEQDKNRVVNHPHDPIGLICEKYATCEGMANGLVELFKYFSINATVIRNQTHGMVKVYITDDNGEKKVSYIDLSREISPHFEDTKYQYNNGQPIKRTHSINNARPNSYSFFLKKDIDKVGDDEKDIAIDFKPPIKIISINSNTNNNQQQNSRIHLQLRSNDSQDTQNRIR